MAFQTSVEIYQSPAVEGDFASADPRATYLAGDAALVADASGVTIAAFAWVDSATNSLVSSYGDSAPSGFVHRDHQGLIETLSDQAGMTIPEGYPVTLFTRGAFWVRTATAATVGQKIFASTTDGSISTGASGGSVSGAVETAFTVASAGAAGDLIKMTTWA